jgi:arsenate reductase-like glutaredoxin family protein
VVHFDLKKDKPDEAELLKAMLGPTGNLRAPALRAGKTLLIGFNEDMYQAVFA